MSGKNSGGAKQAGGIVKGKKGLNLIVKLTAVILVPMILLVIVAVVGLSRVGNKTAVKMAEEQLITMKYMMLRNIGTIKGKSRIVNGQFYIGDKKMSGEEGVLAAYKENTGVDTLIFMGTDIVASSLSYSIQGSEISSRISNKVLGGEGVFCADGSGRRDHGHDYGGSSSGRDGGGL